MHSLMRWIPLAACIVALSAVVPAAALDQGKGKGQGKQEQSKRAKPPHGKRAGDDPQMRFRGVDRNRDGIITRAEWDGDDRSFQNHDWNGDGILSGDEIRPGAARPGRIDDDERLTRWDINRDGVLSRAEWQGTSEAFHRLDINRDGVLSRAELVAGRR